MIIDIIIIVILAFSAFIGYKKGLVGILLSLISLLLAVILAIFIQGNVANYLYNETTIGTTIEESIKNTIELQIKNKEQGYKEEKSFINMFFDTDEIVADLVDENANKLTMFVLKGISFVGVFILVFIICYILRMILNIVFKLPILNSINKFGGVGLNVLKAIFKIWIILAIISFISFMPIVEVITNMIDESVITKFLYENNIIVNILKSTLGL